MPSFSDQLGRTVFLPQTPRRIISLVPSQTELLYTLGLADAVVGITKFCIHPESWFHTKTRVGGTKAVDRARVDALQPDLIIANKEENDRPQIEALAARYPVWISDIKTLADALAMIRAVGEITGTSAAAIRMAAEIASRFQQLPLPAPPVPAIYIIWRFERSTFRKQRIKPAANALQIPTDNAGAAGPYMAAGGDTFISHMLRYCGYTNFLAGSDRYPTVDLSSLAGPIPPTILLSSEPYPFRQRHIDEIKEILPDARVRLVDGEFFSWYGSRLLEAPKYFRELSDI
ncbi:helical backbone metal receptor [Puia sp.]|jgi:ABC-type Fe3+-hydroxamate transport system substrate-binding protein|uniref:helical backbone metal receptor n=1 Tax=Puia sp. TaxID=2045100 RepID=UPI002F42F2F6